MPVANMNRGSSMLCGRKLASFITTSGAAHREAPRPRASVGRRPDSRHSVRRQLLRALEACDVAFVLEADARQPAMQGLADVPGQLVGGRADRQSFGTHVGDAVALGVV